MRHALAVHGLDEGLRRELRHDDVPRALQERGEEGEHRAVEDERPSVKDHALGRDPVRRGEDEPVERAGAVREDDALRLPRGPAAVDDVEGVVLGDGGIARGVGACCGRHGVVGGIRPGSCRVAGQQATLGRETGHARDEGIDERA